MHCNNAGNSICSIWNEHFKETTLFFNNILSFSNIDFMQGQTLTNILNFPLRYGGSFNV